MLAVRFTSTEYGADRPLPATKYFPLHMADKANDFAKQEGSKVVKERMNAAYL